MKTKLFTKINDFFKNHSSKLAKNIIICVLVIFAFGIISIPLSRKITNQINNAKYHFYTSYEIYQENNKLHYDSIKSSLTTEINKYIQRVAPTSSLDGIVIINNCIKYDIDICFVLAQGEQESHFGTQGMARKTNSVFNVYAFDGHDYNKINENGKYRHPNDCVEPYLSLLKRDYLINGLSEYDMLNEYTNYKGQRYASSETYEKHLTEKFIKIKTTTRIDTLSLELKKYQLILGY